MKKLLFIIIISCISIFVTKAATPTTNTLIALSPYSLNTNQFDAKHLPLTITNLSGTNLSGFNTNQFGIVSNMVTLTNFPSINSGITYLQPLNTDNQIPIGPDGFFEWRLALTNTVNIRIWVGLNNLSQSSIYDRESPGSFHAATFKFSTNSPNWFFITGNGGSLTSTDTGVIASNFYTVLTIELKGSTNAIGYINGISVATNTTTMPTLAMQPCLVMCTLANSKNALKLYSFYGEQDW